MPKFSTRFFNPKGFILILLSFFFLKNLQAQQVVYENLVFQIDSLAAEGLPKSALKKVDELDVLSRKNQQPAWQVKAAIYRITFQSQVEEDVLAAIISGLKKDIAEAEYPVKPVLQSVLAETLWKYYKKNRYIISKRSRIENPGDDYTRWDIQTLIQNVSNNYKLSLQHQEKLKQTDISIFSEALAGDSSTRYLRPSLYDFLAHRALDFYLEEEASITKPQLPFSINNPDFFSVGEHFSKLILPDSDTSSTVYQGLLLLQELTRYHLSAKAEEAAGDVDLKRLEFLYRKAVFPGKDSLYLNGLEKIAALYSSKPICADALFNLGQFYKQKDSLVTAIGYLEMAVQKFPKSPGGENAARMVEEIKQKKVSVQIEDVNIPHKPILALLQYQNSQKLNVEIFSVSQGQYNKLKPEEGSNPWNMALRPTHDILIYLKKLTPIQKLELMPPDLKDYKEHRTEFKIEPLKPGRYLLLVKDETDNLQTELAEFQVSDLSFTGRADSGGQVELLVMNRETGLPLSNVSASISQLQQNDNRWEQVHLTEGITGKEGRFIFSAEETHNLFVKLTTAADTLESSSLSVYSPAYFRSIDEAITERTILFTDRQIYRPGQTIYFKGLFLKHTKEGNELIVHTDINVDLIGANRKKIDSHSFRTNEFGTFSGSFIIPQNTLNGSFRLSTDNGSISVRVEEYKRPSFNVRFNPVKETYRFNDSIRVQGSVSAFAGYGLSNAKVAYNIIRTATIGDYRLYAGIKNGRPQTEIVNIVSDTIETDNRGSFHIDFKALLDTKDKMPGAVYTYNISASATDASGETRTAAAFVTVGNPVIRVNALIKQKEVLSDSLKIPLSLSNLNGQLQRGNIRLKIYSLQQPAQFFKKRLWEKPDTYILDRDSFKKNFPAFAYQDEDDFKKWEITETVFDKSIAISENQPAYLGLSDLKIPVSALYLIEVFAENTAGDTCSAKFYTTFITDKPGRPSSAADWAFSLSQKAKKGEKVVFYTGIGKPASMLMEVFSRGELISSERLELSETQQRIEVPYNGEAGFQVQFLLAADNRLYHFSEQIFEDTEDEKLDIRFLTFRNKLQPGEKEQWKLQVSSKEGKTDAEMLAALYDASLNDISPKQPWYIRDYPTRYSRKYSSWSDNGFVRQHTSRPFFIYDYNFQYTNRQYEQLDMIGFSYYSGDSYGYRTYLRNAAERVERKSYYEKNAALVKKGFDAVGRVVDGGSPLAGVTITIKGTSIVTTTDAAGYFKIKVPYNSALVFSYIGYLTKTVKPSPGKKFTVSLSADPENLNEVVLVGYGVRKKASLTGSVMIRGIGSPLLQGKVAGTALQEDNTVYNFASIEVPPRPAPFLPKRPAEDVIRKNFNETAFFYPQLRTNEKGEVSIEFTIPEALTRWQFRALAHTRDLRWGYLESEVITQKQLMISANTPRFLREGDTITLAARVVNLQPKSVKVKVGLQLFDAVSLEPVKLLVDSEKYNQSMRLSANANGAVFFKIAVPSGLDALTYRLTADGGKHQDGEENILPVLPNRMLVTEAMPMMVRAGQQRTFTFDKLVNQQSGTLKSKTLMLEYSNNPAWYAVQALPYLMEYPYECSEQTFSRYYANSIGTEIIRKQPLIKTVFNQWKNTNSSQLLSNLEKNQELKSLLIEETPWLRDAENESEQKKRIALLFDLNKMSNELDLNLDKLIEMQLPDGSFPWFAGAGQGDRFITQHILAGIGQLYHLKIADAQNEKLKKLRDRMLDYLDKQLIQDYKKKKNQHLELQLYSL